MEFVIKISQFLLSLSLLIILHEFGHYLPARAFKTRVEKFFLFFDVKFALVKKKIGDTVYGIGWLPLGGYVKISGMIDESMDKEQMAQPPQPWEFRSKPAWQRLIIMLGGVIVNFIIAFIIYIFASFYYGDTDVATESLRDGFWVTSPVLQDIGIQTGDKIVSIDGEKYENYTDLRKNFIVADEVVISRDGETKKITLPEDFLGKLSTSDDRSLVQIRIPFIVGKIPDTSANANSGLKVNDIITSVNGKEIRYFDQFADYLKTIKGQSVPVSILRDNETRELTMNVSEKGRFGIETAASVSFSNLERLGYLSLNKKEYGFFESFGVGADKFVSQIGGYWQQLKKIFTPSTGAYKGVGGFKAIFDIFPDTWSWQSFWSITAFLSIMLGVLNLLPIPALDGGHVMFLLWEMISGKKPNDRFMEYAQMIGFFLLIALLLFANGNDILRAFK
ncbi:MAG: RIP metalloprotease RseP [Flavobacteriaceae bacterium]|nr:RIP metalloprotease RseP [Flavobacteriaceae bacterium]